MHDLAADPEDALRRAKAAVGSAAELGRRMTTPITGQAVNKWRRVPAERVIEVERITGIPRQALRPDLYPVENTANH